MYYSLKLGGGGGGGGGGAPPAPPCGAPPLLRASKYGLLIVLNNVASTSYILWAHELENVPVQLVIKALHVCLQSLLPYYRGKISGTENFVTPPGLILLEQFKRSMRTQFC